jgi:hypothetical protein
MRISTLIFPILMEGYGGVPQFLQAVSKTFPLTESQTLHSTRFPVCCLFVLPIDTVSIFLRTDVMK